MAKFRVMAGIHIGPDKSEKPIEVKDQAGNVIQTKYPSKTYPQGSIVNSDVDLVKKHGEKFQYVSGNERPLRAPGPDAQSRREEQEEKLGVVHVPGESDESEEDEGDDLESMTVADLKAYAGDNEIDLGGAHKKDDIIQAIRDSR